MTTTDHHARQRTANAQRLQDGVEAFVRAFQLHRSTHTTPCGQPISLTEAHALSELCDSDTITNAELADRLQLDKSTVSRLVSALERRGWVERTPNPAEWRSKFVQLTDDGRAACDRLRHARRRTFEGVLAQLPGEQHDQVVVAIEHLTRAALTARADS
jgi:DNA-binding MarR family transcriptional regulator